MAGAPVGNQNAAKGKRWQLALEAAVEAWPKEPSYENCSALVIGLRKAAHAYVGQMLEKKDLAFFKEFGDRIDGKSVQANEISGPGGGPVEVKAQPWNLQPVKPVVKGKGTNDERPAGGKRTGR